MKLIHIENKIDPNDVVRVMREAKLDFAREIAEMVKNSNFNGKVVYGNDVVEMMRRLLNVSEIVF